MRNGLTAAKRRTFLDTLAATCSVRAAAAAADADPTSFYLLRRRDPAFAAAWVEALLVGYEHVESTILEFVTSRGLSEAVLPDHNASASVRPGATGLVTRPGVGMISDKVPAWVQVGLLLLNRHRAAVHGEARGTTPRRMPTAEETDAMIAKRLDQLARSMARARAAAVEENGGDALGGEEAA